MRRLAIKGCLWTKGFPCRASDLLQSMVLPKLGCGPHEMLHRGRDGSRRKRIFLPTSAGHTSGACYRDHSASNCLEPAVDSGSLLRGGAPRSRGVNDSDRLAEVSVLPFSRLPECCLGEFLEILRDVLPGLDRVVEHQGHLPRAVPGTPYRTDSW